MMIYITMAHAGDLMGNQKVRIYSFPAAYRHLKISLLLELLEVFLF